MTTRRLLTFAPLAALLLSVPYGTVSAQTPVPPPSVFDKDLPESIEDLKQIQDRVKEVLEKVIPATVNVRVGGSQGSGVIVKDGYILTAGHVSGKPGQRVTITFYDGTRGRGETMGRNTGIDSGLIKINGDVEYPAVEIGESKDLERGQWVVATGHPGGFRSGRPPVVRVGRVVSNGSSAVRTDCALVGGDSGGPLFDLDGKVIGIHSRIGGSITANHHVPIDTYTETWDRLVKAEEWGRRGFGGFGERPDPDGPYYGIQFDQNSDKLRIDRVEPGDPADKAGLRGGDLILEFEGKEAKGLTELREMIRVKKPGDKVAFKVQRGDAVLTVWVTVGKRGE